MKINVLIIELEDGSIIPTACSSKEVAQQNAEDASLYYDDYHQAVVVECELEAGINNTNTIH